MATRELAAFLRTRRDRIQPAAVGLPAGGRRRSPGLRRAEVAQLAGISPDYYMRLEQGRDTHPSAAVLDGLARALRLNDDERDHLYHLARATPAPPRRPADPHVDQPLRRLLDLLDPVPAYVLNGRLDVLAWNRMGAALITDFSQLPPERRNMLWFAFRDPLARTLYADWEWMARHGIAQLRTATGRAPDDAANKALVGELAVHSAEFRTWWARHDVKGPGPGRKELHHPRVGRLVLDCLAMLLPGTPDHQLVTYTAPEGSPSQAALEELAALTGPVEDTGALATRPARGAG
ncbi:helix-turn-helix transcriptional regulator [Streptomyces litchfieldiae]|uniref:Helix-turn-helix transcriptional regulator n=1 Tax=Streptomyces litchfieldiae TaxID=3075543 RepID=A0ABU2ML55_9ACTN|nr:helix-turn-helix transcriptional regulator [Streptomyces sp. DSM 44938]MDT0342332.1 helix-turn-helix transcriptional regulator [Streptomyces sp. DSM 44938]